MVVVGVFLVASGILVTHITGAMPGRHEHRSPAPLRFKVILVVFGLIMIALGAKRLLW